MNEQRSIKCPNCGIRDFDWRCVSQCWECHTCGHALLPREALEQLTKKDARIAELEARLADCRKKTLLEAAEKIDAHCAVLRRDGYMQWEMAFKSGLAELRRMAGITI